MEYKDAGYPIISCTIGIIVIDKTLLDLGASVNLLPYSVNQQVGVDELKPTKITLQFRGEQSSVITEITDQKLKPEPEPNRTALVRSGFDFGFQNPNPTEPNRISLPIYHPT